MRVLAFVTLTLCAGAAIADNYEVSVTRKGSNLYKVTGKDIYIHTRYCYEYVYYEDAILRMQGRSGDLVFVDQENSCDVKAVFGAVAQPPGKYKVTVTREDDDWYEIMGMDTFIKTSACITLAVADDAILKVGKGGFGTLYFVDDDDDCMVEGVYERLRL